MHRFQGVCCKRGAVRTGEPLIETTTGVTIPSNRAIGCNSVALYLTATGYRKSSGTTCKIIKLQANTSAVRIDNQCILFVNKGTKMRDRWIITRVVHKRRVVGRVPRWVCADDEKRDEPRRNHPNWCFSLHNDSTQTTLFKNVVLYHDSRYETALHPVVGL